LTLAPLILPGLILAGLILATLVLTGLILAALILTALVLAAITLGADSLALRRWAALRGLWCWLLTCRRLLACWLCWRWLACWLSLSWCCCRLWCCEELQGLDRGLKEVVASGGSYEALQRDLLCLRTWNPECARGILRDDWVLARTPSGKVFVIRPPVLNKLKLPLDRGLVAEEEQSTIMGKRNLSSIF